MMTGSVREENDDELPTSAASYLDGAGAEQCERARAAGAGDADDRAPGSGVHAVDGRDDGDAACGFWDAQSDDVCRLGDWQRGDGGVLRERAPAGRPGAGGRERG